MVIHVDDDSPMELPLIKKTVTHSIGYKITNNHIREISIESVENHNNICTQDKKKRKRVNNIPDNVEESNTSCDEDSTSSNKIDKNDIDELIRVYRKCKAVVNKIEQKYGHLLNDNEVQEDFKRDKRKRKLSDQSVHCTCGVNQKIIFDDFGNQTVQVIPLQEHICTQKLQNNINSLQNTPKGVVINYDNNDMLPNDMKSLLKILKNDNLDEVYRNSVVLKIKTLQNEFKNELRFEKTALLAQLKSDPENLLEFNGSNVFDLPGYLANNN